MVLWHAIWAKTPNRGRWHLVFNYNGSYYTVVSLWRKERGAFIVLEELFVREEQTFSVVYLVSQSVCQLVCYRSVSQSVS